MLARYLFSVDIDRPCMDIAGMSFLGLLKQVAINIPWLFVPGVI